MTWDGVRKYISRDSTTSSSKNTHCQGTFTSSNTTMASLSSKREVKGSSNSVTAYCSNGFRTQIETPGAPVGTAQVTACCFWSGASGSRLPTQIWSENTAAVPSILMPLSTMPSSVS